MRLLLVLALVLTPLASAEPLADRLDLSFSEVGTITAASTHDYDGWTRKYDLQVDYSRVEVATVERVAGVDAWFGPGELYVEALGTLRISLDDQGDPNVLSCALDFHETTAHFATVGVLSDFLVVAPGGGFIEDDAWTCEEDSLDTVHADTPYVPTAAYAVGATGGLVAGTFSPELAVLLGVVDEESEWTGDLTEHAEDVVETGFVEALPEPGRQEVPYTHTWDVETEGFAFLACGPAAVTDTPSTTASCRTEGKVVVELKPATTDGPRATGADGAASSATKDAPGLGLAAVVATVALLALARRR